MSSSPPREAIEWDGQRAVVGAVGATLESWETDGRAQLAPFGAADFGGKVLLPWPNRIRDGRYRFAGREHVTPVTEPDRGNALHGLVLWDEWRTLRRSEDRVALGHRLDPQPGYPFALALEVEYALTGAGLEVTLRAENTGSEAAPFGGGFHPYLAVPADDAVLEVPARTRVAVDERMLPTGDPVPVDGRYDLRAPLRVGALELDTCFGNLERDADGIARVRISGATLWMDEGFRYVHVYTADAVEDPARRRGAIAVEPLTCAPDAFNTGEGLITLAPGASFEGRWGLTPQGKGQ